MKTALAWIVRIIGLTVTALFAIFAATIFGVVMWASAEPAITQLGFWGAMGQAAVGIAVCVLFLMVGLLCVAAFLWASDHLEDRR